MATKKAKDPWDQPPPRSSDHTKLSPASRAQAKRTAKKAGRKYPNLVDNMNAAKKQGSGRKTKAATPAKRSPKKKASSVKAGTKPRATAASGKKKSAAPGKDPKGGLTAAGRQEFARKDGAKLRPGVQKPISEMTPTEMRRKGSWAARFYGRAGALPPLLDKAGQPTRFALTAAAWGEPVPKTVAAARRIAAKGRRLLERYRKTKDA